MFGAVGGNVPRFFSLGGGRLLSATAFLFPLAHNQLRVHFSVTRLCVHLFKKCLEKGLGVLLFRLEVLCQIQPVSAFVCEE